jgi:hypothetical protein
VKIRISCTMFCLSFLKHAFEIYFINVFVAKLGTSATGEREREDFRVAKKVETTNLLNL